jgi:carbon-monoxide dehydrogenase medium subunit
MCGVAAAVTLDADGAVVAARAAYVSVGPTPTVVDLTETVTGRSGATADWGPAGELARSSVEPESDIHASADYRSHLTGVLTERALRAAAGAAA